MSEDIKTLIEKQTKAQEVDQYSSMDVIELMKNSMNIHWQQTIELTSQAVHFKRWGYKKLGELFKDYAVEEHGHAMIVLDRLEFFDQDYQPFTVQPRVWRRHDVEEIIRFGLEGVHLAAKTERAIIAAARIVGDEITANTIIPLLQGSDDGIKEYEAMLKLIEEMGIDNFLTLQV